MSPLWWLSIPIGLTLAVGLAVWIPWLRMRSRFGALAAEMGAVCDDLAFTLDTACGPVRVDLDLGHSRMRRKLEVELGRSDAPELVLLRRETWFDRLGKALAINREAQVGDRIFDSAVYIESELPENRLRELFADEAAKRAVLALLSRGFDEIRIHSNPKLVTAIMHGGHVHVPDGRSLREVIAALHRISGEVPTARQAAAPVTAAVIARIVAALVLVGACFSGHAIVGWAQESYQPVDPSIYGAALLVAFCAFAVIAGGCYDTIRGRSDSFPVLVITVVLFALALPGWTIAAVLACNAGFDRSPAQERRARVVAYGKTASKYPHHYIRLADLRDDVLELEVEEALSSSVREGEMVSVETGAGALGWVWIRKVTPLREEPAVEALKPRPSRIQAPSPRPGSRRPNVAPAPPPRPRTTGR